QVADVQTVGGGIKSAIKRDRRLQALAQFRRGGAISHQAAPFQFIEDVHGLLAGQIIRAVPAPGTTSPISQALCFWARIKRRAPSALSPATMTVMPMPM